ncbi:NADH-quinone oxidoreductase subunit NuoN [Gordonia sp. (in: high G+C Gram-positive bacteria)]|uniref:NADH-quinone oxidoreductase subunit NuoN n=1 Tax=Gordonia sp. (in: high G+C Gram-positive bacteria) TaxID=84139 RepID=UPI0016B1665D|nr:NADH-quinone oxidoreductase subunit NuoN [Gordonia sp. (in: high G+C Gram-positive bacteria)]NLG46365.1 NADH-quinone oxidoreductase subunit NuoN [Gordonia sp. (in: high G+C Gram-positive bacteria)]
MTALAMDPQSIDYFRLSPMLIVFGVAVVSVLVEAFAPAGRRYLIQLSLAAAGLVASMVALGFVVRSYQVDGASDAMSGAVVIDGPSLFLQGAVLVVSLGAVAVMGERRLDRVWAPLEVRTAAGARIAVTGSGQDAEGSVVDDADLPADAFTPSGATVPGSSDELIAGRAGTITTEVYPLALLAIGGMMLFGACGDLLTMFIALEVLSLPLYLLCALARRRRLLSQEASLKYFLLGAFSSAVFLFGASFAYGATGSLDLGEIGAAVAGNHLGGSADRTLALLALALIAVGLLFKVGAVPFGSWVPDVYQGAPSPVTALMASATKVAAFGALLRVLHVAFPSLQSDWRPALWVAAIATMVIATLMAVTQHDIKRMLAYSSVSHVGFALVGAITISQAGVAATLFYVAAYAVSAFGAFALLSVVRDQTGREATDFDAWTGLGRRRPLVGAMMSLFLLAFAGIPLTSGFIAKFAVFSAAGDDGAWALVIVGVVCSAIAAYFYIRVIVAMFFAEPAADGPDVVTPSLLTSIPIAVSAAITLVLGIFPQWLLDIADAASTFLR